MKSLSTLVASQGDAIDSRYHPSAAVRRQLNKVFPPTHWSFLLGEIALYSFVVLLITGVYLTLFFDPSMREVTYNGVYQPLRGIEMSRAYASTLDITFEVRGGLFVRQVHHWAALLFFAAAIMVHLARVFFTGAFRRPREANWVIGSLLLILAMFEGSSATRCRTICSRALVSGPRCPRSHSAFRSSEPGCTGRCSAATSRVTS